jgi:aminomethyltransferase
VTLRTTVLTDVHRAAGAKLADFGGVLMPIEYPTGVVAEHTAVRTGVGLFDVSHMGKLVVRGPGAVVGLNALLANDLERIGAGRAQYTMLCNDAGGVVDDLIAYRVSDDEVRLVPNAANAATVRDLLAAGLPAEVLVEDRQEQEGILAVQGPASRPLLAGLGLLVDELPYMAFTRAHQHGRTVLVCRTGYTGEHGYEVVADVDVLPGLWSALAERATPCGLGARDTLRTEMGYPLHGQDISESISPVEAGLAWAVGWDKPAFSGRAALLAQRAEGRGRALRGLRVEGRGVPRAGMPVMTPERGQVGRTTSGTFSPTLRTGIALALVDPELSIGDQVEIDVRGRAVPAHIVRLPFVPASPK